MKKIMTAVKNSWKRFSLGIMMGQAAALAMVSGNAALADDFGSVSIDASDVNIDTTMGKVVGLALTIFRWVGVVLLCFGIYEIVMSFMQNQPEAKTKGVIMCICGIVMIAMKSVLVGLGVVSSK